VHSAGGVVVRRRPRGHEAALISVGRPPRWQLPKGKVDPGEAEAEAALREVREETGVEAELIAPLATIEYWFQQAADGGSERLHKRVAFYLMRYVAGDVRDHDDEVHEARWFPMSEAADALHFRSEREVLARAQAALGASSRRRGRKPPRVPRVRS
jgi:8-oxo-dGTP pyrophosphatase MutT (NUDIX family)